MSTVDHNPQAAFISTKSAPKVFGKAGPAITIHTPMTWFDWTLATITALALGCIVYMLVAPTPADRVADQVVIACQEIADSAFIASLGGMKADSPCGEVLGL